MSGTISVLISQNGNIFQTTGVQLNMLSCGAGQSCPTPYNDYEDPKDCTKGSQCSIYGYKQACPPGYYQDQTGRTSCIICPIGKYCPSLENSNALVCPDGYLCPLTGISYNDEMQICPEGFYCPAGTTSFDRTKAGTGTGYMNACPAGYWCGYGVVSNTPFYSKFSTVQGCNDGIACTAGSIDQTGTRACNSGSFCIGGKEVTCSAGTYCPDTGMTQAIKCPPGLYNSGVNQISCIPCSLGTLCSSEGATFPFKCTPGFVCSLSGQIVATSLCPGGSYCEGGTVTSLASSSVLDAFKPKLCNSGTYCLKGTRTNQVIPGDAGAAQICMEGIYCDVGSDGPEGQGYCSEGYYCPLNSKPIPADPGYFASGKGNVKQEPCPPGTFSSQKAASQCQVCPAGYYCPNEAMISPIICPAGTYKENDRNTIYCKNCPEGTWSNMTGLKTDTQCTICDSGIVCDKEGITNVTTQARSCPEGYLCGKGTTSATENSNPCPAGFWCSKGTAALKDLHVCEKGYYCSQGTTESGRYYNKCPTSYFCPKGTAANLTQDGKIINIGVITNTSLYDSVISAKKTYQQYVLNITNKTIDDSDLQPVVACDEDSSLPTDLKQSYVWLVCPQGTTSEKGSWCLGQCKKDSTLSGQQSVINPIMDTPNTTKASQFIWQTVNQSLQVYELDTLQYAKINFDFSNLPSILTYNDVYIIVLTDENNASISMPSYFDKTNNGVTNKQAFLELRLVNTARAKKTFKLSIRILDGLYLPYASSFKNTVTVKIYSPSRAEMETNKLFGMLLYNKAIDAVSLPYNLRDFSQEMYVDMTSNDSNVNLVPQSFERDPFDSTLWDSKDITTIAMPWLPFFGTCDGQDRHILLYDLLEDASKCNLKSEDETISVTPIPTSGFYPIADRCEVELKCRFEEDINRTVANSLRWYKITSDTTLFYITSRPVSPRDLLDTTLDNDLESVFATDLKSSSDGMIPVIFSPQSDHGDGVPTLIELELSYMQESSGLKILTKAKGEFKEYTKGIPNEKNPTYKLKIRFIPMNYFELITSLQFAPSVYILLSCIVSVLLIISVILFWLTNIMVKRVKKILTLIRIWQIIEGGVISMVPVGAGIGFLYLIISQSNLLYTSVGSWDDFGASEENDTLIINKRGRIGVGFLMLAVIFLSSGASMLIPKPDESEEDRIKDTVLGKVAKIREIESKGTLGDLNKVQDNIEVEIRKREENDVNQRLSEMIEGNNYMIYKQSHFFIVCVFVALFLLMRLEFSYTSLFRNNTILFLMIFMLVDIVIEYIMVRMVLCEALLVSPILGSLVMCNIIMTLGAKDFMTFVIAFFVEMTATVISRIYLNPLLERVESIFMKLIMYIAKKNDLCARIFRPILVKQLIVQGKLQDRTAYLSLGEVDGGEGIESILSNVNLFITQTQSLFIFPIAILMITLYSDEIKLAESYQIRKSDMIYFLIFSLIIVIPQLLVNIFLLHSLEVVQGIKIFDYFTFSAYRYKTRVTSWINTHWPLDRSLAHAWRSLDQTCFSSQFYLSITISTWGILFTIFGLTIILKNSNYMVLYDPYIGIFVMVLVFVNSIVAYLMQEFCKMIQLWDVSKKDSEKNEHKLGTCPLDYFNNERILIEEMHHEVFKEKFLTKNKEWIVHNIKTIIDKGDRRGRVIYQEIVNEGAKQENKKNEGAKARRNRAMLPYNKNKGEEMVKNHKLEISAIQEDDFPKPSDRPHPDPRKFIINTTETPPRRIVILRKWHEKALVSLRYQEMIGEVHAENLEARCRICKQKDRLQIALAKPFDVIFRQYQRETVGMPFNATHWQMYYKRHQRFKTICAECAYVNNVMENKFTQCNHLISKNKKEYLAKMLKPKTLRIFSLWKVKAQFAIKT